jgi:hypothetical protein
MSKFKVDLSQQDRPERFSEEGEYTVVIDSVDKSLTPQGFEKVTLILKDAKNRQVKDDLLNKETVHWRLNQLIIATGLKVANGAEFDFSKSGEFFNFVRSFVGMTLGVTLKNDSYEKNGETKTFLKVQRYTKPVASSNAPAQVDSPF